MGFVAINPNPKNRLVGDCVIRAISVATDETWNDVYLDLLGKGYEMKDMPSANNVWGTYLHDIGYERYIIPDTCPNCYSIREFAEDHPEGKFIVATGSHVVTVKDGDYYDSWDSGNEIPLYFFMKKESKDE